jgi:hypothetical protein
MNMPSTYRYEVAKEFSRFPGGRRKKNGPHSGEEFRESIALPLLQEHAHVTFDLTGSAGYSSGFLDEAFGELGKILGLAECERRIELVAGDDEEAVEIAWARIRDAAKESGKR